MTEAGGGPADRNDFYDLSRSLLEWGFDSLYDFSVSGIANVPRSGSLILASNHVSFLDPPAVGVKIPRHLNYFARDTLHRGLLGHALHRLNTIPVARDSADIKSLKAIFRALKQGGGVVIFPEGTRSPDGRLAPPKPGAGMIAIKSGATVVPVRTFGCFEVFGRQHRLPRLSGRIHVAYGPPMATADIDPGRNHPERYLEGSRRIMERIAALQPPQEGGV